MCEFPSWIELKDGTVLFLTDADIGRLSTGAVADCCGHSALREIYPACGGKDREGWPCPPVIATAIRSGKMSRMAAAGGYRSVSVSANGQFHRDDGPAIEYASGSKAWYRNGQWVQEARR